MCPTHTTAWGHPLTSMDLFKRVHLEPTLLHIGTFIGKLPVGLLLKDLLVQ